MKKFTYRIVLSLIASSFLTSDAADLKNETSYQERIKRLETELSKLKEEVRQNEAEDEEKEAILEKAEMKSILDKIDFTPKLELRFDKLRYENDSIKGETTHIAEPSDYSGDAPAPGSLLRRSEYIKNFKIAPTVYFDLDMSGKINENLSFRGRLSFAKNSQSNQRLCILSRDIKSQSSASAFDVTLAYFDYTLNKSSTYKSTLTLGILPTFNGTPIQYAQNTPRESMFPALVFDMNSYGLIFTQKIDKLYIRAVFAQGYTLQNAYYPYQCNRENIDNATIAGIYADTTFNFAKTKALLSLGLNGLFQFKAHPYLGPDVTSANTKTLGDILTTGIGIDLASVASSNFDLFFHTALSIPKGNGNIQDYKITHYESGKGLTKNGKPGFTEANYATGAMLKKNGYALFGGLKYTYNEYFDVGLEYNHGSKYWFAATQGAKNMYNKLAIRGDAYEVYTHYNYNANFNTKLGLLWMNENYTGSGWHFGEPAIKHAEQQITYLSFNIQF